MTTGNFHRGIPLSESQKPKLESVIPTRELILHQALEIVTKDRNQDYGNPEDNFATIANYWTEYLCSKGLISRQDSLTNVDVAAMMILMKCSRLATSPGKQDHWIDIAGYSSCGGECAQ